MMTIEEILLKMPVKILIWFIRSKYGKKDLKTFIRLLDSNDWKKVSYHSPEKWIFNQDNSFVIEESDTIEKFTELWTQCFPNKYGSFRKEIYLKISSELIEMPLIFISLDGGRYFVPMPKLDRAFNETYYWDRESVEYKVYKIIGFLDGADIKDDRTFESFAKRCDVIVK